MKSNLDKAAKHVREVLESRSPFYFSDALCRKVAAAVLATQPANKQLVAECRDLKRRLDLLEKLPHHDPLVELEKCARSFKGGIAISEIEGQIMIQGTRDPVVYSVARPTLRAAIEKFVRRCK
jgi:hypothetical protein